MTQASELQGAESSQWMASGHKTIFLMIKAKPKSSSSALEHERLYKRLRSSSKKCSSRLLSWHASGSAGWPRNMASGAAKTSSMLVPWRYSHSLWCKTHDSRFHVQAKISMARHGTATNSIANSGGKRPETHISGCHPRKQAYLIVFLWDGDLLLHTVGCI